MANNFVVSWERARYIIAPSDPDLNIPYSSALVTAAMIPGAGAQLADKTFTTQIEFGLALNGAMGLPGGLTPGVSAAAIAAANAASTVSPPNGDGNSPLYLMRTDIVAGNPGAALLSALGGIVDTLTATFIAAPFFGTPPPAAAIVPLVQAAWTGSAFGLISHLFDATMIRYISSAYSGGEA